MSEEISITTIGRLIGHAKAQEEALSGEATEARQGERLNAADYLDGASHHNYAVADALMPAISCLEARSLSDSVVQLCYAYTRLAFLWDEIPNDAKTFSLREHNATLERLLTSVLRCLERESGVTRESLGIEALAGRHMDPWTSVHERIAEVDV